MSIESVPYPTREISTNLPLFLSDIGAVAVPIPVTGTQTIVATKGSTYITYGSGTITFTDPNISTSVSGDYYKVIVGGTSVAIIGGVSYTVTSPIEILRLVSAGAWITHSGLDASQITTGIISSARLPSYVDDVLEFANFAAFPATGETSKIYIALDRDAMKQALRFCEMLLAEGKEVYLVDLQDKDPSEMGFKNFTKLIQNTVPLTYYDLMERKLAL
jgi:hypothetical protein